MHRLLICLGALIALSACGTKGPLYIPPPATATAKAPAADHSTAPKEIAP